jgi:tetratricopeptide (TPR) repeat protein
MSSSSSESGGPTTPASLEDTAAVAALEDTGHAALAATASGQPTVQTRTSRDSPLVRGASLGRYLVLEKLGAGGMGIVYAAYDPELDRRVALKLLLAGHDGGSQASEGRVRLLREAQAMAKLGHPNVIAVHDVGTLGDQVFVAMEFVDGQTLRSWLSERPRSWREVIAVLTRAGRGLAAAHAAGLVHRDFKPDNVMIDRASEDPHAEARVRVMDFGLARPSATFTEAIATDPSISTTGALSIELTQRGAMIGTPAYMAPEQIRGEASDARVDQFAFCVTLWEALFGQRPFRADSLPALVQRVLSGEITPPPKGSRVPVWIRKLVQRGLAIDPERRFASMHDLLGALARDPARARRRWAAAVAVGALGIGAFGWQRVDQARTAARCDDEGAEIRTVWGEPARAEVQAALLATGAANASETWERLVPWLDRYAARWDELRAGACRSTMIDATHPPESLAQIRECLDERKLALAQLVAVLRTADSEVLRRAIGAATLLPLLDPCVDHQWLTQRVRPPDDEGTREQVLALRERMAHSRALADAGRVDEALALVGPVLDEARAVGWTPLVAEAELATARVREAKGDFAAAEASYRAAYLTAGAAAADDIATEAAVNSISVVGDQLGRHDDALAWVELTQMGLARMGEAEHGLRAAHLHRSAGFLHHARGDYTAALAEHERALAMSEPLLGAQHPTVGASLAGIGLVHFKQGKYDEAIEYLGRAAAIDELAFGPNHPDYAHALDELAAAHHLRGDHDEALALHSRALAIRDSVLGPDHPSVALSLNNLGNVHQSLEDFDAALVVHQRALAIWERALGPEHPDVAASLYNLARLHTKRGVPTDALECFRRSLAIAEKALGADHPHVAYPLTGIGIASMDLGRPREAIAPLERALALREKGKVDPNELAESKFTLARALWAAEDDRARARELARSAEQAYAAAGAASTQELTDVRAWLAKPGE